MYKHRDWEIKKMRIYCSTDRQKGREREREITRQRYM